MALPAFQSQGTVVATGTTAPAGYPTSFAAGDLLLLFVSSDSASINTSVTGWTSMGAVTTGGGVSKAVWTKIAAGTETGNVSVAISGGTKGEAYIVAYRSTGSGGLIAALRTGIDSDTSSLAYDATGASWGLSIDDRIVESTTALTNAATFTANMTGPSFTQAGATIAAATIRFAARTGTNTIAYHHSDAAVTGAGTGSPHFTATGVGAGANAAGVTAFILIREAANVAPTVVDSVGNQSVAASTVATLGFTATDTDGSIASRATTYDYPLTGGPAITGGTTAAPSFTTGTAPNLYVVRQTATDNGGATGSASTEVRVLGTGNIAPMSGYPPVGSGSWTNVGGAASEGAALNDASDTTYVESPSLTGTETERRWRLNPATTRAALSVTFRVAQDTAGTIVAKGRLYEGNTLRQEWTLTTTTSAADQVCVLSSGTVSAITDWGNLWAAVAGSV